MARAPSIIRQQEVTRALRAAKAAGLIVSAFEVDPQTGKITVSTAATGNVSPPKMAGAEPPEAGIIL
jgi:hypothetical protein